MSSGYTEYASKEFVIQNKDEVVNQIPRNISDLNKDVQTSWNDLTDRPFYTVEGTQYTGTVENGIVSILIDQKYTGCECTLTYSGDYKYTSWSGNFILGSRTVSKADPSMSVDLVYDEEGIHCNISMNNDATGEITASISSKTVHLDEQFISENIARTSQVDQKITDAFNDFATKVSDDKVVNSYKELIDYAAEHGSEFTELVGDVTKVSNALENYKGTNDAAVQKNAEDIGSLQTSFDEHTHTELSSLTITDELILQNEYDDASFVKVVATDSEGDAINAIRLSSMRTDTGEVYNTPVEVMNVATPVLDNDAANKSYVDQSRVTKVSQLENDSGFLTSPLSYEDMPDGYATASGANTVVYSDECTGYMLTQSTAVLGVSSFEIEDGQLYEVFINGKTYRCHAVTLEENCITLGSIPTTEDGSFTGEEEYPFGVVIDTVHNNNGSVIWYHTEEDGEPDIKFSATKIERMVTPFNEEFIPDSIARTSQIPAVPTVPSKLSEMENDCTFCTRQEVLDLINSIAISVDENGNMKLSFPTV